MATSGYVETNSYNGAYLRLDWTRTSYDSTLGVNYTHWVLKGVKSTSGYYYARKFKVTSYNFVTGNTTELYSSSSDIQLYNGTVIAEGDEYFTTNSDGTCRIQFNIEGAIYSYEVNCTGYDAWDLDTIPRKSSMTVSAGTIGGTNPTFTIKRKSNNFTDSIYYINPANSQEVLIVNKTSATTYNSWAAPTSLYASFPNDPSITLTYKIYTYNGSTLVGSDTATGTINANVSASRPTVSVTATPTNYSSLTGNPTTIIGGVSNVTILATATAKNSATIKSIVTNGTTIATNATSGSKTINKVTTGTFKTTVTDSRGFTNSPLDTKTFEFVNYVPVSVSANTYRINATSSTVKAVVTGNFFNAKFGTNGVTNTLTLTWQYKLKSASSYTTGGTLTATKSGTTYTTNEVTLGTNFSYENDYDFLFTAVDKVNTSGVTALAPVKKGTPIFDYGVDSNGNNYLNVNGGIYQFNIPIIERGTNYIKFYDGTAIWRKTVIITTAIQTAYGNWYESSSQSFGNFDTGLFIERPYVFIQARGIACWVESLNSTTKDYVGQAFLSRPDAVTSRDFTFDILAIGKWK
ncbi:MAG: hypothetical protein II625_01870 [Bacilli bacterium]|nr:hypothetical protein [Bacilli bacterium]